MRSPVIVIGQFAFKFARGRRGRASNLYELHFIEQHSRRTIHTIKRRKYFDIPCIYFWLFAHDESARINSG